MFLNTTFRKVSIMIYKTMTWIQRLRSNKAVDKAVLENKFLFINKYKQSHGRSTINMIIIMKIILTIKLVVNIE